MGIFVSTNDNTDEDEEAFRKPPFYRGREGPKFSVLNFTKDYEYRRYESSTCISVNVSGLPYSKAVSKGSSILSRYFNGKNGPEKEMSETCPLKTRVECGKDISEIADFVVSLHLPFECQSSPPAPRESMLFIQEFPEELAYVATFEGVAKEEVWQEQVLKLAEVLDKEKVEYDKEAYYTTRYEKPLHLGKKRNEVILIGLCGKKR